MKNITSLTILALAALALQPFEVNADVPETIPIQGRLTDAEGIPLDGDHTLHFALYDASDNELHSEAMVVSVADGDFTAYLGEVIPLDTSLIDGEITLGIAVGDDVEMTPRIPFGSVPFAIHTPQQPPGMVAYFDLPTCPESWSPLEAAAGRTIVGVADGGTLQGQVGMPLDDLEERVHSHTVDPPPSDTSSAGSHSHDVATNSGLNTGYTSISHSHGIPVLVGSTDTDSHNHRTINGSHTDNSSGVANVALATTWTNPPGVYVIAGNGSNSRYTDNDTHSHSVTTNANSTGSGGGSHRHSYSVPAHSTASASGHTHTFNTPSVSSSNSSATMPYVQLLACRKD